MQEIPINLAEKYKIYIGEQILQSSLLIDFCCTQANTIIIIVDKHIEDLYGKNLLQLFRKANIETYLLVFAGGEEHKTRETKQELENKMFELGLGRDTCIIALGGGITTDIAGFTAATYNRGIPVVYVPTTLLSMVDASIGGKTAVNTPYGKNLIGAFYQPKAVFIDVDLLKTLPENEFKNGMVEIIKHAIIKDAEYFNFLENNIEAIIKNEFYVLEKIIAASCRIKKQIIEQDERDYGIRQILNFGHTIGHALEQVSNYQLSHGNAVALGIIAESYISMRLGFLADADFERIKLILQNYKIPVTLQMDDYSKDDIKKILLLDKKAIKRQPYFVLIDNIGQFHMPVKGFTTPVDDNIIDEALCYLQQ
jgi:3-dehydroquinate synthase